ncbi:MAG: hypothetical protein NTX50_29650 [Candidatus Sumerlaeota bacterium]|nr:hypothetical protein [Candidatus Sumerlaeota bacterium]
MLFDRNPTIPRCSACGHPNEPPYFFCYSCGTPRTKLGKWRTAIGISITMTAFLGYYYFRQGFEFSWLFPWAWPIYVLYCFFFIQFSLSLVSGVWSYATRFWIWFMIFLPSWGVLFHLLNTKGPDSGATGQAGIVFYGPSALLDLLANQEYMYVTYPVIVAIAISIFSPAYFRWAHKYGWTNSYRIIVLTLLAISLTILGAFWGAQQIFDRNWIPDLQKDLGEMLKERGKYDAGLVIFLSWGFRILIFEILVVSAVKGYGATHAAAKDSPRPNLKGENGFTRAVIHIAIILRMLLHSLENMIRYIIYILRSLGYNLWQIFMAFMRELFVPTVTMSLCAILLYLLTICTEKYVGPAPDMLVSNSQWSEIVRLNDITSPSRWGMATGFMGILAALLLCDMIFLGCKTRYRWQRIAAFYGQLTGWLLPNIFVFFLVMSVTLVATSLAFNQLDINTKHLLPFRIGLLTQLVFLLLVGLIVMIMIRKRTLFLGHPAEAHGGPHPPLPGEAVAAREGEAPSEAAESGELTGEAESEDVAAEAEEEAPEGKKKGKKKRKSGGSLFGAFSSLTGMVTDVAQRTVNSAGSVIANISGDSTSNWKERMTGRPLVAEELSTARARQKEVKKKIDALEKTKATISPETFHTLSDRYMEEMIAAGHDCVRMQKDLDEEFAVELANKLRIQEDISDYRRQETEMATLLKAGALGEAEHKENIRDLRQEMARAEAELKQCLKNLSYLEPLATKREGEKKSG